MPFEVSISALREHLGFTDDLGTFDDLLLNEKVAAATQYVERLLGYRIDDRFAEEEVPKPLEEAVLQLAAHWYENREAAGAPKDVRELPFGFNDIVREYREFSF